MHAEASSSLRLEIAVPWNEAELRSSLCQYESEEVHMKYSSLLRPIEGVAREPQRLLRLHYSKVLAWAHSIVEADNCRVIEEVFNYPSQRFEGLEQDLTNDRSFQKTIEERWNSVRGEPLALFGQDSASDHLPFGRLLYCCVRLLKPRIVVDTGVLDGFSSAFILKGLHDNGRGHLCSIDLPAYDDIEASSSKMRFGALPKGHEPGWIIPDILRGRWTLRKGPSSTLLPPWLEELNRIDMFFHDSLHTYQNMLWEYITVWPHLNEGGLLASDDVFWNPAFWVFARRTAARYTIKHGAGLMRKE